MTQKISELSDDDFLQALIEAFKKLQSAFSERVLNRWEKLVEAGLEFGNPLFEKLSHLSTNSFVIEFEKRFGKPKEEINYAF